MNRRTPKGDRALRLHQRGCARESAAGLRANAAAGSVTGSSPRSHERSHGKQKSLAWLAIAALLWPFAGARAAGPPPLTAVCGNPRLPGKFVRADLFTDNAPSGFGSPGHQLPPSR
jgi:hypothetical protein